MRIAIVGGGLAGVALSYYLQMSASIEVTLFDQEAIGSGASGAASGLMHPYVGEELRRSHRADEAFAAAKALIEVAAQHIGASLADFSGIERVAQNQEQLDILHDYVIRYGDISYLGEQSFLMHLGATIDTVAYLQALWGLSQEMGAKFQRKKIVDLTALTGFDHTIVASGVGIFDFSQFTHFRLSTARGQSILNKWPEGIPYLKRSRVGKGYLASTFQKDRICMGATFEKGSRSSDPDREAAICDLGSKMKRLMPELPLDPIAVKAGVRVSSRGHYFPLIGEVSKGLWVMTGLGSRGLLYHALFAQMLSNAILYGQEDEIPIITKQLLSKNKQLSYNLI
ncbi:MAG: FAD-binding oxidoreductase [Chlamydiae bacterium]|nr:FAD-binding oxidoreductase [Chlamydiota bacterium]